MVIYKILFGILLCWVLHIVVLAENVDVSTNKSINMELESAVSNSRTSSEEVNISVFSGTNKDKQGAVKKESPQELPLVPAPSKSAFIDKEHIEEYGAKEGGEFKSKKILSTVSTKSVMDVYLAFNDAL